MRLHLLPKQVLYWCLAFRLATQEVLGWRQQPADIALARRLHREAFRQRP
jgi:hypothetical protein